MRRCASLLAFLAFLVATAGAAYPVELRFQTQPAANLLWMVDQLSQWHPAYTSVEYRAYWEKKLAFNDEDLTVLDRYARLRRKLARLNEKDVRAETSPWVSLFGRSTVLPHEKFVLAFLETRTVAEAAQMLGLSEGETKILNDTLLHFARKMKDLWPAETAHLKDFSQKAQVLVSLADAGGFIEQMQGFFGIKGGIPDAIPVDVLWAPPGFIRPAHLNYHIILPVSVDKAGSDEAVLQHLSMAIQEVAAYLLTRIPEDNLAMASSRLLSEAGCVNPAKPDVVREALKLALGEVLFLRERFPDLPRTELLVPYDVDQVYPYAVDELARRFAVVLKDQIDRSSGFFPGFLDQAIAIHKVLFPPRPAFFATIGALVATEEGKQLFDGMFANVDRRYFAPGDVDDLVAGRGVETSRTVFVVVTAKDEGLMWKVLKGLNAWRDLSRDFKKLSGSPFLYAVPKAGSGMVIVVRGTDMDGLRKALIALYNMQGMPLEPLVVE